MAQIMLNQPESDLQTEVGLRKLQMWNEYMFVSTARGPSIQDLGTWDLGNGNWDRGFELWVSI